jgi:serine/threonine protein kinase
MIDSNETTKEIEILKSLKSLLVIEYIEDFAFEGVKRCVVTEFCSNGDLEEFLIQSKQTNEKLPFNRIKFWNNALLGGLAFLHSKKIIHRDIKPR